jgi:hypothetical protein
MNIETLKVVGQVAGIGGLALGTFLLLFRDIIRKSIFPSLTKEQAYRLLLLIVILIWSIAICGIAAWTYIYYLQASNNDEPNPTTQSPTGIFLKSARLLELETLNQFFLEVIVENTSSTTVPLNNLILRAQLDGGFRCGSSEPPNPWQNVVLDWNRILSNKSNEISQAGWTILKDEKIKVFSQFKLANCSDYHHRFETSIPIQIDLEPNQISRMLLRVNELNSDELKLSRMLPLGKWDVITVSFDNDLPVSPKEIKVAR